MNPTIISCEGEKREPAIRPHQAGLPYHRRIWTCAGIPGDYAPTGRPEGCWTAFPSRSGVDVGGVAAVVACCAGRSSLLRASLGSCRGQAGRWSPQAYPWIGPKWATSASGLPNGACTRAALARLALRTPAPPFFVGGADVVGGVFVGGEHAGLPVELAPWLALLANLRPKLNDTEK